MSPDYILHQPGLESTSVTPDGARVITYTRKDARNAIVVQHWDACTGQALGVPLLGPASPAPKFLGFVYRAYRPDGRWAAAWAAYFEKQWNGPKTWIAWNPVTCASAPVPDEVRNSDYLQFSRDGLRLAVCRRLPRGDSECRILDAETWKPMGKPILIQSLVAVLRFAAEGRALFTSSNDGRVRRWAVPTGELLGASENLGRIHQFELSPDGTRLFTLAEPTEGKFTQQWYAADLTPLGPKAPTAMKRLFFVPGGRHDLTHTGDGGDLKVWDSATGRHLRTLNEPVRFAEEAANPGGAYVALTIPPHRIRLRHLGTGKWIGPALSFPAPARQVAFFPDGTALCVSCEDGTVRRLPLPAALPGSLPQVKRDIELLTQKRLSEDGSLLGW